jgi:hypothetical protein
MEVVNKWLLPMPYLVWSPSLDTLGRKSVQDEHRGEHAPPPPHHHKNQLGIDMALSMLQAILNTDWFLLLMMPFCSGVYGAVRCLCTLCSQQYLVKP